MSKTAFVLDIGTTKTTCMAATMEDGALRVVSAAAVASRGVRAGRVKDVEQLAECIKIAVSRAQETTDARIGQVVVGVPGPSVRSARGTGVRPMFPAGKEVHEEDLLQVNEHSRQIGFVEGYELVQALPCEYTLDGNSPVADPLGMPASRLEVTSHVMSASTAELDRIRGAVSAAGLEIAGFVPTALASGLGAVRPEEAETGCLLVDIGGGTTEAAVFARGACFSVASINVSSQHVTNDIAQLIKLSKEDAETVKLTQGHADPTQVSDDEVLQVRQIGSVDARPFPRKVLSEIIECRVREIAKLLRSELEDGGKCEKMPATVLLTGGGSQLAGIDVAFKAAFGAMAVRRASPRLAGTNSRKVAAPEMSVVVGLALFALADGGDELVPVSGALDWKERIRSLKSLFSLRS
ncbi:MAG: cell division protein FtsA [Armatimonadetes bacterium]|nr:cell division protein FtsA [Armatimonadota bacterium]